MQILRPIPVFKIDIFGVYRDSGGKKWRVVDRIGDKWYGHDAQGVILRFSGDGDHCGIAPRYPLVAYVGPLEEVGNG